MNCPTDGTPLSMTELKGMVIDYCPKCRGVWLSRDSLNKILALNEKAADESDKDGVPKPPAEKQKTIIDDFLEGFGLK